MASFSESTASGLNGTANMPLPAIISSSSERTSASSIEATTRGITSPSGTSSGRVTIVATIDAERRCGLGRLGRRVADRRVERGGDADLLGAGVERQADGDRTGERGVAVGGRGGLEPRCALAERRRACTGWRCLASATNVAGGRAWRPALEGHGGGLSRSASADITNVWLGAVRRWPPWPRRRPSSQRWTSARSMPSSLRDRRKRAANASPRVRPATVPATRSASRAASIGSNVGVATERISSRSASEAMASSPRAAA